VNVVLPAAGVVVAGAVVEVAVVVAGVVVVELLAEAVVLEPVAGALATVLGKLRIASSTVMIPSLLRSYLVNSLYLSLGHSFIVNWLSPSLSLPLRASVNQLGALEGTVTFLNCRVDW
jgi:hypothetical protein